MLLETIAIHQQKVLNIDYHQDRMNQSFFSVYKLACPFDLVKIFENFSFLENQGWIRCRFIYNAERFEIQQFPYQLKQFSKIKVLEIPSQFNYKHKWNDRQFFAKLLEDNSAFEEVLMLQNDFVTDVTIGNVALWDGDKWYCPNTPLLEGTQRKKLLKQNLLTEISIKKNDLTRFEKVIILNAFRTLDSKNALPISVLNL